MNTPRRSPRLRRAQAGVTLIETTTVSAVVAVLAGVAAPAFDQSLQRRHLEGAATQLETDIHQARMLAVARNAPLRIRAGMRASRPTFSRDGAYCGASAKGSA